VVVVVCVCVLLLVTVLTVGVVRLRAAHKRAAEEEVEMAWDDTALNITVNPLEVSYTLIKKKRKFSSFIRKFRMMQLQSHIHCK
jgi:hypothetical protein